MTSFKKLLRFVRSSHHCYVITGECVIGLVACFLSLLLFVLFAHKVFEKDLLQLDLWISYSVYAWRTPFLTQVMIIVTQFGSMIPIALATLCSIIFLIRHHQKEAVLFCLALVMGGVLNSSLKLWTHRTRPQLAPLIHEETYSFPSGHAMNSFLFYSLSAYFSYHFFRNKKLTLLITVGAIVMILLIGLSRIYLGVHYFTDVIAGYIAGFWWFITVLLFDHTLIFFKLFKKNE